MAALLVVLLAMTLLPSDGAFVTKTTLEPSNTIEKCIELFAVNRDIAIVYEATQVDQLLLKLQYHSTRLLLFDNATISAKYLSDSTTSVELAIFWVPSENLQDTLETIQQAGGLHKVDYVLFVPSDSANFDETLFLADYSDMFQNLYWIKKRRAVNGLLTETLYVRCFYCNAGKSDKVRVGSITSGDPIQLRTSFEENFYGAEFITSYIFVQQHVRKTDDGKLKGYAYNILQEMENKFNFIAVPSLPTDGSTWGRLVNGRWSGFLGMVSNGEAEFSFLPKIQEPVANQYVDFTVPVGFNEFKLLSSKPQELSRWLAIFTPYSTLSWILILISVVVSSAFSWYIFYMDAKFEDSSRKKLSFAGVLKMWAMQSVDITHLSPHHFIRLALGVFFVSCFIIKKGYEGSLVSFLLTPRYGSPIDSMEDVQLSPGVQFITFPESILVSHWKDNQLFQERLNLVGRSNSLLHFNMILESPGQFVFSNNQEYLKAKITSDFVDSDEQHGFHIGRDAVVTYLEAWPLRRNAPYRENFNKIIMALQEAGIINKWKSDSFSEMLIKRKQYLRSHPNATLSQQDDSSALELAHLQGAFFFLLLGLSAGIALFAAEHLKRSCF